MRLLERARTLCTQLGLSSEHHLSGVPLVNKNLFVNKDSFEFGKEFILYHDKRQCPSPKRELYVKPQGALTLLKNGQCYLRGICKLNRPQLS